MSKKNSNVNLRSGFKNLKNLFKIFLSFKKKLNILNKKKYLIAVSGGPDSLALAALAKAYSYNKKSQFYFVLVNHNIRKNSDREANQVKKLLKRKNINLKILSIKKKITKNIQAEARNSRYNLLVNFCKKKKINTLITAHNLEDQVETFFIRLSRGSGLKGLSAMKPTIKIDNQVSLFRPLLDVKKRFLFKISKNIFGKYFKDPSNKNKKYLRTKIRSLKRPLEKSGIKYEQIFRSIQNLSSSKITLDQYFDKIFKELVKKTNKQILIKFERYKNLKNDMKIAILNKQLKNSKITITILDQKIQNLIKNIEKKGFKKSTLEVYFFKKGGNLCLKVEKS